jgi:ABC-type polysaccharide/polyol phosphate transport system ATPase subunit/peptidoglycan/LPS O-acetylase OafA/YrhL
MKSILVEDATKRFTLRHAHSIKEMSVRALRRQSLSERFTALDQVSLAVEEGESLALMGLNGSGKSTLLKLVSGVMRPDAGAVRVRGRVAGLIEVGAGLHPDLTGRENIFLNAAILGMSKAETEAKYDAIVAFAEIEKFLDTQVKFYSSGMFMRLGFSVAVHTEPDVFLVDEVLAVGDPPFQQKCLESIQNLRSQGRTLVIVSHDMGTLEKVCERGVVLREGHVAYEGGIQDAVDFLAPPVNAADAERRSRARREAVAEKAEKAAAADTARLVREVMPEARRFDDPIATLKYGLALAAGQDGMALEFGVWSGRTLRVITEGRDGKNVFGFDSFEGLPEDWRDGFPAGTFAMDQPPEVLGAELVTGLFAETLPAFLHDHPEPVAFLHIDADLYSSARTVLEHAGPRLRPGSVVVFDEYFNYPGWREHEYRAWQEYVAETGIGYRYEAYTRGNEQVVVRVTEVGTEPAELAEPDAAPTASAEPVAAAVRVADDVRPEPVADAVQAVPVAEAAPDGDTPPAGGEPRPARRLRELDLLRFVAAIAVMMHHFTGVPTGAWPQDARKVFPELNPAANFGYLGVELFFVISGFVILMSVWNRGVGAFAVSRVVRLFPAYWFGVLLAMAVFLTTGAAVDYGPGSQSPLVRFLPNLTMLQTGAGAPNMEVVYWTLWIELHFYVLIALFVWRGITYPRCVAFMAAWLLAGVFGQEANVTLLNDLLFPQWAPYFIAGMAFFLMYRFGQNVVLWLFVVCCWALTAYYGVHNMAPSNAWPGVHQYAIPGVITAIYLVMALVATHRLGWLRWRGLTVLGGLTYPLYLVHETISRPLIKSLAPRLDRWVVLGIAVGSCLTAALLIWLVVERPGQRWMRGQLRKAAGQIRAVSGAREEDMLTSRRR